MTPRADVVQVVNRDRGTVLGDRIRLADRFWARLRGLRGMLPLGHGEGLLLRPCRAVHMFGMPGPLDVAFLDRSGQVVAVYPGLRPGRITRLHRADAALELPPGTLGASRTDVGDTLVLRGRTEEGGTP